MSDDRPAVFGDNECPETLIKKFEHQCVECYTIWSREGLSPDTFCIRCNSSKVSFQEQDG